MRPLALGVSGAALGFAAAILWSRRASAAARCSFAEPLVLQGSVGHRGRNAPEDVTALRRRLCSLGFRWVDTELTTADDALVDAIRLFQSIVEARNVVSGDGRVDVPGGTYDWLRSANAPRWVRMPAGSVDLGLDNHELRDTHDDHDWGTSWMVETLQGAGRNYKRDYLDAGHADATPLTINDVSLPRGGDTPDHAGHECGMAGDVRLPRTDGEAGEITRRDELYDRGAARAQLKAFLAQPLFRRALFNDSVLIAEGLCRRSPNHDHHIHFEILAPPLDPAIA